MQIIPRLDTGGAELSAIEINSAVVAAGGRSIVVTEGGRMADGVIEGGGELQIMRTGTKNPFRILRNVSNIRLVAMLEGVDLIHARSRAPAWSGMIAAHQAGIPFVTTYHGAYAEKSRIKNLYNSVMARGDMVIANSHYTSRLIQSRYGTPEARIRVIHRGVDDAQFDPAKVSAARRDAMRSKFGLMPGQKMILQAARLTNWKGQLVLIEAASRLVQSGKLNDAVVVVLAGDAQGRDEYVSRLETDIARLGLAGKVRLAGHVDDIPAALAVAWVAVIASTEPEAFGRSVTEAAAMGCPAIATDIGAPPETVLAPPATSYDQATGWLVPPGDAAQLSLRLEQALALTTSARAALGGRARAHVLRNFSLRSMKHATLATYDKLLGTNLVERFMSTLSPTN